MVNSFARANRRRALAQESETSVSEVASRDQNLSKAAQFKPRPGPLCARKWAPSSRRSRASGMAQALDEAQQVLTGSQEAEACGGEKRWFHHFGPRQEYRDQPDEHEHRRDLAQQRRLHAPERPPVPTEGGGQGNQQHG